MSKADEIFEGLGYTKEVRKKHIRYFIKNGFLIPDSEISFDRNYKQALKEKAQELMFKIRLFAR